ncbi:hypothetical protein SLA2020_354030 [Shorea laevis]
MRLYGVLESREYLQVREKLFSLFSEYNGSSSTTPSPSTITAEKHVHSQQAGKSSSELMKEYDLFEGVNVTSGRSQLELYLDETKVARNAEFDILSFWKGNEFRYPEVAAMARDILSIPVSTVASESTFSVGGRVIDQYRSSLKPDVVEALVCTRDWLYGKQEHTQMTLDEAEEELLKTDLNSSDIPTSSGANSANIPVDSTDVSHNLVV